MMGPAGIGEAGSQLNVLLDLVSDPKKYAAQVETLQNLAKAATDAQAANQAILDETNKRAEQAKVDRAAAETAQAAAHDKMIDAEAAREAANRTLADAQALRNQANADAAETAKAKADLQTALADLDARKAVIAKREQELTGLESVVAAKEKDWNSKLARLKDITG